jgi:hypothetical protein
MGRNRIPVDLRSLCRSYTDESVRVLASIMRQPEHSAAARVAAAGILLDRGWGKAPVTVAGEDGSEIKIVIRRLIEEDNAALNGRVMKTTDQDVKAILGTELGTEEE